MADTSREGKMWQVLSNYWRCTSLRTGTLILVGVETVIMCLLLGYIFYGYLTSWPSHMYMNKMMCTFLVNLVMSGVLVYGVVKERPELVNGWLWLRLTMLAPYLASVVGDCAIFIAHFRVHFWLMLLFLLFSVHNFLVVRTYYSSKMTSSGQIEEPQPDSVTRTTRLEITPES